MESIIYQIKCIITEKVYIGSTIDRTTRWNNHKWNLKNKSHHSIYLQRSWDKYGEENFEFSILEYVDPKNLIEREQYYLNLLRPFSFEGGGFNSAPVAGSTRGHKRTPEQIEKTAKHHRGKKLSEERKKQISESGRGRKHTQEAKDKMRISKMGDKNPQWGKPLNENQRRAINHKKGIDNPFYNKTHTTESRKKLSDSHIQYSVEQVDKNGNVVAVWKSVAQAAQGCGLKTTSSIYRAIKDPTQIVKNHFWRKIDKTF